MPKRVLDVGQCGPDHAAIRSFLDAALRLRDRAGARAGGYARRSCSGGRFDLVLVNRKLDQDYSDGIEIIRQVKADPATADVPVMLVTNYPEHQEAAVAAGAVPGFGKLEFDKPETREKLAACWKIDAMREITALFLHDFFDRLDEVGRFAGGGQLFGLFVGQLLVLVLEQGHALERLIEDAPKGLEADFLRTTWSGSCVWRALSSGRRLSWPWRSCPFLAAASASARFSLIEPNLRAMIEPLRGRGADGPAALDRHIIADRRGC